MKRHGLLAAGILGSATAVCLLLNRFNGLSASEEEARSFRQALHGTQTAEVDEVDEGFRINYYDATWNRVLQDLAKHNELTLVMDKVPPGRFARKDKRTYDVDAAIRILNSELETQGYRLLRQKQFLVVLNLDKARTEYARPRLSQDTKTVDKGSSSTDSLIRSASSSRIIGDAADEGPATPLLEPERDRFEPQRGLLPSARFVGKQALQQLMAGWKPFPHDRASMTWLLHSLGIEAVESQASLHASRGVWNGDGSTATV